MASLESPPGGAVVGICPSRVVRSERRNDGVVGLGIVAFLPPKRGIGEKSCVFATSDK